MKMEKLEKVEVEETKKVTVTEFNDWITVGSEIIKRVTPLFGEAFRALKSIETYLNNHK